MFIVFVGPPGVGKGTQCRLLSSRLGLDHVSTGDLLRKAISDGTELGRQSKQYIERGRLVPDEVIIDMIDDYLRDHECAAGYLFDGFPRNILQAEALDCLLAKRDEAIDLVIQLTAAPEEILNRLAIRAQSESRPDDKPETIRQRLEIYQQQTHRIVEYYDKQEKLRPIDGLGTPEEVFQRILTCVRTVATKS
jgi:adenylate kinase